jgi:adenosylcobinamide-phosphate synthase
MLVGRDTEKLTEEQVIKAAVETVAENTSDGVVAPFFWMALFGAAGGLLYKAIKTMDSMVGYKNDRYLHFGRAAAKLDDGANYVPARLSALAMIGAAFLLKLDGKGAWGVWRRDRRNHASPNSAQTESACAGALGVRLGGDASYFGQLYKKPTIGDPRRPIERADVHRACNLMYGTSGLLLALYGVLLLLGGMLL